MLHILNHNDEIVDYFDINDGDIINPEMVRNVETLEDTLEFSVISNRSLNVQERNRVIIKDNENEYREFIIMQYESNIDGFTDVSCVGSHLEDFASAKPFKPQRLERYSTNQAITFLASDTGWELAPDNEWNGLRTTSWSSWKDRLSLLKQLQTTYDMRLSFYIELGTNRVKHRYVKLKEVNPMFNGEEIVYGENMIDLKRSVDFTDVATALVAIGPEDDDGNRLIIEMKDDEAQEQLGLPYRYLWQIYEPESDDAEMTEARLKTLARTKLNKVKAASVTYTIQSTQLDVKVGDMIRVKNEDFTPELYVEAEIIEIKYNPFNDLCDYKFGILTEYTREEIYDRFNKLLESLRARLANISYNTETIINERFEEELKDLERYIHKSPSAPIQPQEGDLWLDTSHNQVAVLRRYENGEWIKSSVSEAHDINAPTREEVMYQMITERSYRLKDMMLNNFGTFNNLTNQKHYGDLPRDIRDTFSASFTEQSKAYTAFERDYNNIHPEQPTIGLIVKAMDTAIRFEQASLNFNDVYAQIRAAYDSYIELLQRQYSDEKYEEALNEIADKFGLEVVDGKLIGDANFIDSMNEIRDDLQKQLDDAKAEFDELEIGGRNLLQKSEIDYRAGRLGFTEVSDYEYFVSNENLENLQPFLFRIELEAGKYIISGKFKAPSSDYELRKGMFRTSSTSRGTIEYINLSGFRIDDSEEYVYFSIPLELNVEEDLGLQIYLHNWTTDPLPWFYIKELQVEKGTVATDWSPAPEDTDNKITNLNQSVTNIEGKLESTVNRETFDVLDETVTKQGTLIGQTADELKSKADSSRVDTINNTVTEQGTLINQTSEELKLKANQKDLDTLNNTVSEQGTEITANAQEIALRARESDLNTVTGRVDKAEADIEVNAREISSRVKDLDYQTDKDGIINRLSGAESSLTQQSKLISSKVGSTELTQAVNNAENSAKDYTDSEIDNIEIGGRNLIPNSNDFKSRYRQRNGSKLTFEENYTVEEWATNEATRIHITGGTGSHRAGSNINNLPKNTEMVHSIYVKNLSEETFTLGFNAEFGGNSRIKVEPLEIRRIVATGVGRKNWDFVQLHIFTNDHMNDIEFAFWHEQLEFGTVVTDWTPSPEDAEEKIKENENRIIKHDTKFEQTDTQLSLKATMTDVNQSDETLSKAISELVIDSANGLKFNYDSNGRLASYSVGRDGIQFDGSKIVFKASDSIMLQISDAKKAGTDAQGLASDAQQVGENAQDLASDAYTKVLRGNTSGENLIKNTDFWNNADNWNRTHQISNNDATDLNSILDSQGFGRGWIRMKQADGGGLTYLWTNRYSRNYFSVTKDKWYTFSVLAATNYNNPLNYVYMRRNSDRAQIKLDSASGVITHREKIGEVNNRGVYKHIYTFKAPFTASDVFMFFGLSNSTENRVGYYLSEWKLEEGDGVTPYTENFVADNNIITSINLTDEDATISGKKINLVGDVNMVNGEVRVRNLTASSGTNKLELTGSGLVMDGSVGNLSMGSDGIVYRDSRGVIKYEMNENFVRSSTFGTTTANIYMAASNGYEVRFVDIRDVPGLGTVNDYRYIDARMARLYTSGIANNTRYQTDLRLGADGVVAIMNNGLTTYGTLRSAGLEADYLELSGSSGQTNLYIRPESSGEVRITNRGTTTSYASLRARNLMANSLYSNTSSHLYLRADSEIRLTSHGSTSTYRSARGLFAYFDAFDVNTGTHMYARPKSGGEFRVTRTGTTGTYEDIRFKSWYATSSEQYKTDIKKWDYNVLDILKNDLQLYSYKFKSELDDGVYARNHHGVIIERETPIEWRHGDGVDNYEMATWTLKGVQELAQENDELKDEIKEQGDKIEELQKQMAEVMALLNKE